MGQATSKDRECVECGRLFRGTHLRCAPCQTTDRICGSCKREFRGRGLKCDLCRRKSRTCTECKRSFLGNSMRCSSCWGGRKACIECGTSFKGTSHRCQTCRAEKRHCAECQRPFKGLTALCGICQAVSRECVTCGRSFRSRDRRCGVCYWNDLPREHRAARLRSAQNRRRALRRAAQVDGPVPAAVYAEILASGPCVYCGTTAEHVDHVRPLSKGGWEHESNLVPACEACNLSKKDSLLDRWIPDRVLHGVMASPKVAAEYARVTGTDEDPSGVA